MSTKLFYFSGTGNSLKIAKDLSKTIPHSSIEPMARYHRQVVVHESAEAIGFIFPLYFFGIPAIVSEFVKKLELRESTYTFAVITRGGTPGCALYQLKHLLKEKLIILASGFYILMGTNFIPKHRIGSPERLDRIFKRAEAQVNKIAQVVNERENNRANDIFIVRTILSFFYNRWVKVVHNKDSNFWVEARCDSCSICVKVCPVNNILLKDGKPRWLSHCQQCLACIHFCPLSAIQYGKGTVHKKRYHNPDISVEEIIAQKMQ